MNDWRGHLYKSVSDMQGTINWRASSNLDFIQNYFLLKHMFNFFDNRNECCKSGFLRGNICTSCTSMVLLDRFANKSHTFLIPSLAQCRQLVQIICICPDFCAFSVLGFDLKGSRSSPIFASRSQISVCMKERREGRGL